MIRNSHNNSSEDDKLQLSSSEYLALKTPSNQSSVPPVSDVLKNLEKDIVNLTAKGDKKKETPHNPAFVFSLAEANAFIDVICDLKEEPQNLEWIHDLEFGMPNKPMTHTRHIANYDHRKKVIMSASQAYTVHPGFLRCNERFRDLLVRYYVKRHFMALTKPAINLQTLPMNYADLFSRTDVQKKLFAQLNGLRAPFVNIRLN